MMNKPDAQKLLDKYKTGTCTEEELAILETWYKDLAIVSASDISERDMEADLKAVYAQLPVQEPARAVLWPKIAIAAAMVTIVFGAGLFYYNKDISNNQTAQIASTADIAPGKQGATLTLANGKQIRLSDALNGELSKEAGVTISKTQDGQLIYEVASIARNDGAGSSSRGTEGSKGIGMTNTLSTAKGETYQVKLPDGTVVWLNAASTLKYAANLLEYGKRKVSLQGEAFFKVAKDKAHPFVVKTGSQEVEVLGTQFNINAYEDESAVSTTLLEGSVRVSSFLVSASLREGTRETSSGQAVKQSHIEKQNEIASSRSASRNDEQGVASTTILKPGQQSILNNGKIKITEANITDAIAWKEGDFIFRKEGIESVMRKLARWYNIEVVYAGALPEDTFEGEISRYRNISQVLSVLEQTKGIHFKIEGRKVIVSK